MAWRGVAGWGGRGARAGASSQRYVPAGLHAQGWRRHGLQTNQEVARPNRVPRGSKAITTNITVMRIGSGSEQGRRVRARAGARALLPLIRT